MNTITFVFALGTLVIATGGAAAQRPDSAASGNERARTRVPALPPAPMSRSAWDSLSAADNVLRDGPSIGGPVVRDALLVQFHHTATQAQRQTAIDAIGGEVIGGESLGSNDGFYVVRIDATLTPTDSSSGPLLRARARLKVLPVVQRVIPIFLTPLVPNRESRAATELR